MKLRSGLAYSNHRNGSEITHSFIDLVDLSDTVSVTEVSRETDVGEGNLAKMTMEESIIPEEPEEGATKPNDVQPPKCQKFLDSWVLTQTLKFTAVVVALIYFIIPVIVRLNPWIMSESVFLSHVHWPPFINLSNPQDFGLNSTRTFRHTVNEHVELGVWHILPQSLKEHNLAEEEFVSQLKRGNPIILYMHGNAGTRGGWHRVKLYKLFAAWDNHIITFDYRGFADSRGSPTEDGVCEDAFSLYTWIKQYSANSPVYFWGHSLGSAVATKTAKHICDKGLPLAGLILEAPFNNLYEAALYHPFAKPFSVGPLYEWGFVGGIKANNITFATDENILGVSVPTLILHAEDDGIVPYELGVKLYDTARAQRTGVQFVHFDGDHGYGHKHLHKSPDLPDVIRKFMDGAGSSGGK